MKCFSVSKTIDADHLTPIAAYQELRDKYNRVSLFESSDYHSPTNSKSFIVINPIYTIEVYDKVMKTRFKTESQSFVINDFKEVNKAMNVVEFQRKTNGKNGFFGIVGYDAIVLTEEIELKARERFKELPDIQFSIYQYVVVFDNFSNRIEIIQNDFSQPQGDFINIINSFEFIALRRNSFEVNTVARSNFSDHEFIQIIERAKEEVSYGNVFQIVLSRAFNQGFNGDEFEVYRKLRSINPSPYMFYFDLGKGVLFGASPEAHLIVKDKQAEIHPIAGTIKKSGIKEKDKQSKNELLNNPKELAEHHMLVDLARNDLNANCDEVEVTQFKEIQEFSHVFHIVSKVVGKTDKPGIDVFPKSFPAGTLSGAPKYKALELIAGFEKQNRKYYGGAIGIVGDSGDLNMAIIIRSALSYNGQLHYQAGAGVVLDSMPNLELKEVYNKVGAIEKAILLANQNK